jgi:hypothetical protein
MQPMQEWPPTRAEAQTEAQAQAQAQVPRPCKMLPEQTWVERWPTMPTTAWEQARPLQIRAQTQASPLGMAAQRLTQTLMAWDCRQCP